MFRSVVPSVIRSYKTVHTATGICQTEIWCLVCTQEFYCVGRTYWIFRNVFYYLIYYTLIFILHRILSAVCFIRHYIIYTHSLVILPISGFSVWHMPVAVCRVFNCWWWTERPSETCRVSFQNKINLIHWCIWFVLLLELNFLIGCHFSISI